MGSRDTDHGTNILMLTDKFIYIAISLLRWRNIYPSQGKLRINYNLVVCYLQQYNLLLGLPLCCDLNLLVEQGVGNVDVEVAPAAQHLVLALVHSPALLPRTTRVGPNNVEYTIKVLRKRADKRTVGFLELHTSFHNAKNNNRSCIHDLIKLLYIEYNVLHHELN